MADKILNLAVIGCSGMASYHMQGICDLEGVRLYAVCDTAEDRLIQRKEEFHAEIAVTDYRELVKDPKVDAAVIVTPDKLHLPMTKAFLEAGKAVLCEKPMALTLEECEEMMRVEQQTGGKLMIGNAAVLDVPGVADQDVTVGIRPEGFELNDNGALCCQISNVEVMGRDVSVVSTNPASQNPQIRSIIDADNRVDLSKATVRYNLKPHKVFLFHKETEERIRYEVK